MSNLSPVTRRADAGLVVIGLIVAVSVVVMGLFVVPAGAATDWDEFYQFRHSSSLPGNLFGVSPQGQVGFAGALQQNVPVAYTPTKGNWIIGGNSGSNTGSVEVGFSGDDVNGTAFLGMGWGRPGRGFYSSFMATGSKVEEAYNFQYQLVPGDNGGWAFAVGVQDILNQRQRRLGVMYGARSIYGVATRPVRDLFDGYLTVGWGDGRFDSSPFGGVSVVLDETITVVAEYDGFNANAGLAISGLDPGGEEDWVVLAYFGYSDLDRPVVGLSITKH